MKDISFELNGTGLFGNVSLNEIVEEYYWHSQFVYYHPENIFLIVMYIPIFIVALIANLLVIAIFIKYRSFRTITNCFLMNLSVADLLVTILCMPAAVGLAIHKSWLIGDPLCKTTHYLQGVAVGSSVFTLLAMSIDRYLAIRHPLKRKNCVSKELILKVIMVIWIISLSIFAPILIVRRTDGFRYLNFENVYCFEDWNENPGYQQLFGVFIFVVVYALPGVIIVVAHALMGSTLRQSQLMPELEFTESNLSSTSPVRTYQVCTVATTNLMKERRRIATTLMVLATAFALCWLPSSVLGLVMEFSGVPETFDIDTLHRYFILLGHLNSLLNPLLYSIFTATFRKHVRDWVTSLCR